MVQLIKSGNSQGVRIPQALIKQAELDNQQLKFELLDEGLLIKPIKKPRSSWQNSIQEAQTKYKLTSEENEWLDLPLSSDDEWQW
ncbi:MAG: AbrB/MazE/SpoVT family DNA-binding domain-containing protein [Proteobacteria bacterium]|nr:AbrB/MazE/SpoVT family DNA-binding domain-containing protein [Pseudomonadota bacterium]